ncbi:hypothetical protein LNU06_00380 [Campylobacter sp. VicNov18]|uniref:hypothetical protein n=1 Tax=Campylobacter bilis TaxID=2691918 RepID=UPI00130D8C6F|nr:hypothetical protein [Campylobacter bilis]MPV62999.1 hypothetical protein [Campylobacter hepaticus]MBM0636498.1 hypothetical protein [Campylobacter bilis]MCC8277209.1 hypothetical protein [Campylobacter bilis]MCC8298952.1 hypothetical protein [Campylobacter bilis]MCC8300118.1 hypothetical protein [Campylobacter bilis]
MVKKIIMIAFCVSVCLANSNLELAKNLVNNPSKNSQLELLFSHNPYLDENGNSDIAKISQILKTNSLITLILDNPQSLKLNFKAKADEIMFFKILSDVLTDAGYIYFIPTDLILREGNIEYTIQVESQYILDPGTLYKLLKENSVHINNIRRIGSYDYEYDLDFSNAVLKTNTNLSLNTPKSLEKPLKDYVFNLKNATNLIIDANDLDNWFPKIFFLDQNLNLIQAVKSKSKSNHFSQLIPNGAIYAIISDMYSLDNIRRGLKITLKK